MLDAEEKLSAINISSFPYQKDADRKRLVKEINKNTKFKIEEDGAKILSTEEAAKSLAQRMLRG